MGWNHFKRGYWNETQEHNKKLIKQNGLANRMGIMSFEFNRFLVSKNILLNRDLITQELIDEFKGISKIESVKSETVCAEGFQHLKSQTDDLKSQFDLKEKTAREVIEKRFPSPQMTNDKFNSIVDASAKLFSKKADAIMLEINSASEYSPKLDKKISSDIDVLIKINEKLDAMTDEMLVSMNHSENDEIEDLLDEFDVLTDSLRDYD